MSSSAPRKHVNGHRRRRPGAPVLSEELFAHLLVRERKLSERSNRPFVLLTVKGHESVERAVVSLAAATRETDIVGWVKWPTTVGVVFSEFGETDPGLAIEVVRARLYQELERRLTPRAIASLSIEFRVYPESVSNDSKPGPGAVDPVLHPDLLKDRKRRRLSDWIKRALDTVASLCLLLLLAPLLLLAGVLVRLTSPGPVLFRQVRIGQMGKPFRMLKFRTMHVNAGENPHQEFVTRFIKESRPTTFKLANDRRITPVGSILRKTSVDELPQLWNVLVGQMSLVGPRPPLPYELEHYSTWHRRRILEAKPGITGLWQVMGRSRTTFDQMVRLDLRYARTRSLWTDLWILFRTPAAVVSGKGAR